MKAGPFVSSWNEEIRAHVVALAPPVNLRLCGRVVIAQAIARSDVDGEIGYVHAVREGVASRGELQVVADTPGEQRTGYVDLRRADRRLVGERRACRTFVFAYYD